MFVRIGLLLLAICSSLSARDYLLEFMGGYYRPNSGIMRDIYSHSSGNYQLKFSFPVLKPTFDEGQNILPWVSINYIHQNGSSLGSSTPTSVQIIPVTLGLEYAYRFSIPLAIYAGLGMRYFFFKQTNQGSFFDQKMTANGAGGVATLGLLIFQKKHFFIDLFADYSYKRFFFRPSGPPNLDGNSLQVGGVTAGAGIGWLF